MEVSGAGKENTFIKSATVFIEFRILKVVFALFVESKNISSYLGPLANSSMKIVWISSTYLLVKEEYRIFIYFLILYSRL